ncbi:MAG TPA: thiamine pyrophosphate-dependent enzyme [Cytophagaceae bacterium]|jgi:pyruvate dehydrogenase (quinone)
MIRAASILNEGKKIAVLVGAGALNAGDEVQEITEVLGAGVAKALLGKTVLPDDLPYLTGTIGFFGTTATEYMMKECDTLLMIGTSFPYAEFLPEEGQARAVQIDIDGKMLSLRYPVEENLMGDSKETLKLLLPLLDRKEGLSWREKIEEETRRWKKEEEQRAQMQADPLNPQLVFAELSNRLPDNCILIADSGSTASWFARDLKIRTGMMASLSGSLATMGCAVPYAIAAKFAWPERTVIAFAGDGAMQMNGNEELITIAKYWRTWNNAHLIVCVLNNHDLNMVTWEQRMMEGDPKFDASQNIPEFNYAEYAKSLGLHGIRVDHPDNVESAWEEALNSDKPVLLEAVTDPEISPFPPHVLMKKIEKIALSVKKGDRGPTRHAEKEIREKINENI